MQSESFSPSKKSVLLIGVFLFLFMKLSWSKKLVRKWFNIKGKTEEFQADEVVYEGENLISCVFLHSSLFEFSSCVYDN